MPILNYSTGIKAEKTAFEIQEKLARAKAQAVMCEYDPSGILSAMSFRIIMPQGPLSFRLPVNVDGVLKSMQKDKRVPKNMRNREQAARVAWRITKDWIEAQLAIVEAEMADIQEVFLPYAQDQSGRTLYQAISADGYLNLITDKRKDNG